MKNTIKLFGILLIVIGVFVLVGSVSASDAEELQPAGLATYNEDVTVNGTMRANSAYIGSTEVGVGGVTFFNGTMINGSLDEEGNGIPLTMGDDVRIDGEIWRIQKNGEHPLKVSDNLIPTSTNTSDLGSTSNRWDSLFVQNGDYSGEINVAGDVKQDIGSHGAVKAMVFVNSNGTCNRSWTFDGSDVTCSRHPSQAGIYYVEYAFDISESFYQVTPNNYTVFSATANFINANRFNVLTQDTQVAVNNDSAFMMTIY